MRQEFSDGVMLEIIRRATDQDEKTRCENCGLWVKSRNEFEIDHTLSEGMRPLGETMRPRLTAKDGQLLCLTCHDEKTNDDSQQRSKAKRREMKQPLKVVKGLTNIARRFGLK
jgi:hypothetical protein